MNTDVHSHGLDTDNPRLRNQIRGCLVGGAIGDALGYTVEFCHEPEIFERFSNTGITSFYINPKVGKAIISDDTQMSLFTANGILYAQTLAPNDLSKIRTCVARHYVDWLTTQFSSFEAIQNELNAHVSRLLKVPGLFSQRAPGNTCVDAISELNVDTPDFIADIRNDSKGCGGVMRTAPLALAFRFNPCDDISSLDYEAAQLAAITHSHSLGYMPSAVLNHIISRSISLDRDSLANIVLEALSSTEKLFHNDKNLNRLYHLVHLAVELTKNNAPDLDNIHALGLGWVAEETLAIAIYCALKHRDDFSKAIIAAVNHNGDSDSTGAITGNILGAWLGYDAIDDKWKPNLEHHDLILDMADDLYLGCPSPSSDRYDAWMNKYMINK